MASGWNTRRQGLIDRTFGRLTVLSKSSPGRSAAGHTTGRWLCRCVCGKETTVATGNLTGGQVVSCGCALKGCNSKRPLEWVYNKLVGEGNKRGYTVCLTYEEYFDMSRLTECHYCGATLHWGLTGGHNIDRKDNAIGYSKNNCVVCCGVCNKTKGDLFTYEQFVKLGAVIGTFTA